MKKEIIKKALIVAITLLILYEVMKDNITYLTNWGNAELVGYNAFTLILIAGVGYLIYRFLRSKKQDKENTKV